ncbi:hypothetical protein Q3V30_00790 [Erwinia pyri]|uniref:Uncharacterized protein n=1 Tax=Erwinia pyri TaxID=3062598 RepID=A0AA50HQR9_9GAMM|nr:hypothetical protein [Erwinia sp. DE2]WLS79088.1 hypothetical protein Q3V30_00790 [Erwinia sp. DE2]
MFFSTIKLILFMMRPSRERISRLKDIGISSDNFIGGSPACSPFILAYPLRPNPKNRALLRALIARYGQLLKVKRCFKILTLPATTAKLNQL